MVKRWKALGLAVICMLALAQTAWSRNNLVIFQDNFVGRFGSLPNQRLWNFELGAGGWGNHEKQTYTKSPENVSVNNQNQLVIRAVKGRNGKYTSARINTLGKFAFVYGTAVARIKVPAGAGLHPAFWAMGTDINSQGWPNCGEMDIVETINQAAVLHNGLHGPKQNGKQWEKVNDFPEAAGVLSGEFHNYWMRKSPREIQMGIDNTVLSTIRSHDLKVKNRWVFDRPVYLLLNLAVGGDWPGNPNATTPNPADMVIDWVRVTRA